jgi:hypothetical protein
VAEVTMENVSKICAEDVAVRDMSLDIGERSSWGSWGLRDAANRRRYA